MSRTYGSLLTICLASIAACAAQAATRVYVTNERSGELSVIDGDRQAVLATVPLGKRPRGLQLAPDGQHLYVALSGSPLGGPDVDESRLPPPDKQADGIGIVDLATLQLERVLRGVSDPEQLAISTDGRQLYVASEDTGTTVVMDAHDGRVRATLTVGHEPEGIALSPDGRWLYVASEADNEIAVIDTRNDTIAGAVSVGARPRGIVFARNTPVAYVSCENAGTVTVIDTRRHAVSGTIPITVPGARPMGLALAADGATLYVATGRAGKLIAVDTRAQQVKDSVAVGERPWGVSLSPDGRYLYTANGPSNDVTVVDASSLAVIRHIAVGQGPWGALATTVTTSGGTVASDHAP